MTLEQSARKFHADEVGDVALYAALARVEPDVTLRENLERIAAIERSHADFWRGVAERRGGAVDAVRPPAGRVAFVRLLRRFLSAAVVVELFELGESAAIRRYHALLRDPALSDDERAALRGIILDELEHETFFRKQSHRFGASNVRDFVLGMNDGLVEILGAVTGLSAVYASRPLAVGVSGLVVGLAGALSMGIGAYVSVRSQRQVDAAAREELEMLFEVAPERAVETWRERLEASGLPGDVARDVAGRLGSSRESLARLLVAGGDENELRAGLFTGVAYLLAVAFPTLPYFLAGSSLVALPLSVASAGLALAGLAALLAVISGIPVRRKVAELVLSAFTAAALSFGFGKLLQSAFGIEAG
jgi:VIT1/CCC1 family predicted Fe2+/Mn2+ transporter